MRIQHDRRVNPYQSTWEFPAAALVGTLFALVLVLHVARAIANVFAGAGFTLTPRGDLISTVPAILGGDAAAGLPSAGPVASRTALYVWIGLVWAVTLVAATAVVAHGWVRWGPGRILGMATPDETEKLLGVSRLRRNAPVIRPDLYGRHR